VFKWLKTQKGGILTNDIKWNFSKFLLDREGNVVGRCAALLLRCGCLCSTAHRG
jgi:glutathione peroxidase